MEKKTLKQRIKQNPALKQAVHRFIMHPVKTRPNWWIRLFYFVYLKRGKGSVIYRSVRKDLPPFNQFSLGRYSVVEDFSCLNNAVGDLIIGDYTRIGFPLITANVKLPILHISLHDGSHFIHIAELHQLYLIDCNKVVSGNKAGSLPSGIIKHFCPSYLSAIC
mgnify:CR=1 FL=1